MEYLRDYMLLISAHLMAEMIIEWIHYNHTMSVLKARLKAEKANGDYDDE